MAHDVLALTFVVDPYMFRGNDNSFIARIPPGIPNRHRHSKPANTVERFSTGTPLSRLLQSLSVLARLVSRQLHLRGT